MSRRLPLIGLCAALSSALPLGLGAGTASAAPSTTTTCPGDAQSQCARVPVPLDRRGSTPGSVSLSVRRRLSGPAPSADAVVAIAGGPGQAAIPLLGDFQRVLAPALAGRDLVIFDQRGTGESDALDCPALHAPGPVAVTTALCAQELGPARGSYTSPDSVEDLEAIRQALGYRRLVLFAASYGTKVALQYALRYPQNVESLVLDSVVTAEGPDVFQRSSFQAMGRVLGELCGAGACHGVSASPLGELARLVAQLTRKPLRGSVIDGAGRAHRLAMGRGDLFSVVIQGDENPVVRGGLPGAVHSALRGDAAPLLRPALDASAAAGATFRPALALPGARASAGPGINPTVYTATTCEELQFPWDRGAAAAARSSQAARQAQALPQSAVYPFDRTTALLGGPIPTCLSWPDASPAPNVASGPYPSVPALLLSGGSDVRTPTEDASSVAAKLPGAHVLVVPHTGHSVLGTDVSGCAKAALAGFFAGQALAPCPPAANHFPPAPLAPTRLGQLRGRDQAARTLSAVGATITDLRRELLGQLIATNAALPSGARVGGLRGGSATVTSAGVRLRRLSYVPGVQISGLLVPRASHRSARFSVSGPAASAGSVTLSPTQQVSGTLGGRHLTAQIALAAAAQIDHVPLSPTPGLAHLP